MAQTKEGALKSRAKLAGISVEDYLALAASGLKRCTRCKAWKPVIEFGKDRTRTDGVDASCFICRRVKERKSTKGRISTFKGHTHTAKAKLLLSESHKGLPNNRRGTTLSIEARIKISQATREKTPRGKDCHSYKDGKLSERRDQRFSMLYKRWRFDVFSRDGFAFQKCGDNRGGNLVAHHIKEFSEFPEVRYEVSNGVTVCEECHKEIHAK